MVKTLQILKTVILMVVFFCAITHEQETEWYFFDEPIPLFSINTSS